MMIRPHVVMVWMHTFKKNARVIVWKEIAEDVLEFFKSATMCKLINYITLRLIPNVKIPPQ